MGGHAKFSLLKLLLLVVVISIPMGLSIGPAARAPRVLFQGKDQYAWGKQLKDADPEKRHEAVVAICELLEERDWVWGMAIRWLAELGPEAKGALPTLKKLLEDEPSMRSSVLEAIKAIDPGELRRIVDAS